MGWRLHFGLNSLKLSLKLSEDKATSDSMVLPDHFAVSSRAVVQSQRLHFAKAVDLVVR
jgi:hypothetical protein